MKISTGFISSRSAGRNLRMLTSLLTIFLGMKSNGAAQVGGDETGTKILIMTDLEGVLGIDDVQFSYTHFDYDEFRGVWRHACEQVTQDANAVIRGLRTGGATEIHLIEGHAFGIPPHIDRETVEPGVSMTSLLEALLPATQFPWSSFDGAVLIGLHAMSGTPDGYLSHTMSDLVAAKVNGQYVGEVALMAWFLGHHGVPTIMVTGDTAAIREVTELLPGTEGFSVKTATSRDKAISSPLDETRTRMQEAAMRAIMNVQNQKPLQVTTPISIELDFYSQQYAVMPSFMANVTLVGERTLAFLAEDYSEAFGTILTAVMLAELSRTQLLIGSLQSRNGTRDAVREWWMENFGDWASKPPPFRPAVPR